MKTTIKILLISLFTGIGANMQGIQLPQHSLYMFNNFAINPAIAGTYNHYKIKINGRYQWIGFTQSPPQTLNFSVYGPSETSDMGWGGLFYSDIVGPTSRTGFQGSYAYNIALVDDIRMSFGGSLGLMNYKLDDSQLFLGSNGQKIYDQALSEFRKARWVPDANIGAYLWSSSYYAGVSAHQLIGNQLEFVEQDTARGLNRLTRHYYLTGGYMFVLNRDYLLETYGLIKGSAPEPMQFELSAKMTYRANVRDNQTIVGGISYRHNDAVVFFLGGSHEKYGFGLVYDFLVSDIRAYPSGTVEIMLSYQFDDLK